MYMSTYSVSRGIRSTGPTVLCPILYADGCSRIVLHIYKLTVSNNQKPTHLDVVTSFNAGNGIDTGVGNFSGVACS